VLTPTVTLVHAGSTLTAASAAMQAEVIEPTLTRSSSITPATGAYGDSVQVSFTVQQASSSSRCTYGIEVCDTPNQMQFNPAHSGDQRHHADADRDSHDGDRLLLHRARRPDRAGDGDVQRHVPRLPAGVDRCAVGNATYTSAPSNGFRRAR
jgi:hypothetical protein